MDIEVARLQVSAQQQLNGDISSIDGNDVTAISQSVSDHVSTSGDDKRKAGDDVSEVSASEDDKRKAGEAEQVSASEGNERKASSDDVPNQVSAREDERKGSSGSRDKTTVDTTESILNMSSRPQRCLRLNRRGFYISKLNEKLSSKTAASINSKSATGASGSNIQRKWGNFHKKPENESQSKETNSDSKKSEQSIVTVPRNKTVYTKPKIQRNVFIKNKDATVNIENSTSQEPPKKKHKPITWP